MTLAIDLGDNNVSIRARWPKGNPVFGKSKGFVEKIGGDRFSCAMVMDVNERDFFFGDEALNIIAKTPMRDEAILNQQNLAAVLNLRSDIMDGIERYVKYNGKWTNEYLLRRLFSVLMDKIQAWAKGLFAERRTEIPAGFRMNEFFDAPEFAITYPPMSSEEECEAYKAIISRALLASFSDEEHPSIEQITFISEPQAAINYFASNKKNLLAEIPDGEQIAIIDIGENSSKVTVASVDRNKGVPKLIISAIDKLMIKEGTRELSGNLIDSLIAGVLGSNTKRLLLNPLSGEFLNLWETMWGRAEYVRRDDKLRYSKRIKDKFAADGAVTLKVPSGASFTKMALNYKKYSEVIIDPVMDQAISALRESLKAKGVDPDRISACVLLGGVNICGALRDKFSNLTSEKFKYGRLNDSLEPSERINAVIDGAVLGKDLFLKTSFATLKIKDESGSIDETLIREHEVFLPVTIMRSSPFSENGGASLSLIAESELFETPETLAVAICRQDFADSSEFSSEAVFEISLTQDACICRMFSGSRKEIGWNVKLS